jgi:hypothetical protein
MTLATSFGILVHDTQLDHAASVALALPVAFAIVGTADLSIKLNDPHLHAERISFSRNIQQLRSSQPRVQTRVSEDKKYIFNKKNNSDSDGSEYHWPSV